MSNGANNNSFSWGDALFLHVERPGSAAQHRRRERIRRRDKAGRLPRLHRLQLPVIPRYRQHVVFSPFDLGLPHWEFDPQFDIRNHVREVKLKHGTEDELRKLLGKSPARAWIGSGRFGISPWRDSRAGAPASWSGSIIAWPTELPAWAYERHHGYVTGGASISRKKKVRIDPPAPAPRRTRAPPSWTGWPSRTSLSSTARKHCIWDCSAWRKRQLPVPRVLPPTCSA